VTLFVKQRARKRTLGRTRAQHGKLVWGQEVTPFSTGVRDLEGPAICGRDPPARVDAPAKPTAVPIRRRRVVIMVTSSRFLCPQPIAIIARTVLTDTRIGHGNSASHIHLMRSSRRSSSAPVSKHGFHKIFLDRNIPCSQPLPESFGAAKRDAAVGWCAVEVNPSWRGFSPRVADAIHISASHVVGNSISRGVGDRLVLRFVMANTGASRPGRRCFSAVRLMTS
jgi:hypothetical protein